MARIDALIRRYTKLNQLDADLPPLNFGTLQLNAQTRKATSSGIFAELTGKEFDLLYFLAMHKGKIFTKKQIYNEVWNDEYAIETNNLVKAYKEQIAVNRVNLHIRKGPVYGLLGRNGAGKTTIMKMILGLTKCHLGRHSTHRQQALSAA